MTTIIFNNSERSMREENSKQRGLLGYHKYDKSFACEASDLDCAGVPNIPLEFSVKIEENNHIKLFRHVKTFKTNDEDAEIISWLYKSSDGFSFIVFND